MSRILLLQHNIVGESIYVLRCPKFMNKWNHFPEISGRV